MLSRADPVVAVDASPSHAALDAAADVAPTAVLQIGDVPDLAYRALLVAALAFALGSVWYAAGRGRWRSQLSRRLLYGVPWGTATTVAIVAAFYLFVQGGLWHWSQPLVYPFVSWSYFYPLGTVLAGVAHGSPAHVVSNLTATVVLGSIVEYAWGHYPGGTRPERGAGTDDADSDDADSEDAASADDAGSDDADELDVDDELLPDRGLFPDGGRSPDGGVSPDGDTSSDGGSSSDGDGAGWRSPFANPWVRALVVFPALLLGFSLVTSVLSLGASLGFSGTVFALAGMAVVTRPVAAVVGVLVSSALRTVFEALSNPVVRGTIESGPPAPPSWAGIAVQAHALGFLLGVVLGIAVLYRREYRPAPSTVFLATLLFGMVQGLWMLVLQSGQEVWTLYRGAGMALLLVVTTLVAATVAGLFDGSHDRRWFPRPRLVGGAALAALLVLTALLAFPAPFASITVVDSGAAPSGAVEVRDYAVTYAENATGGRELPWDVGANQSLPTQEYGGVIVVNDDREIWTVAVQESALERGGNASVVVGGVGWRETVRVHRSGWTVSGAGSAYAVDAAVDGEVTRVFTSDPVRAQARLDGQSFRFDPGEDGFRVLVSRDGERVGAASVPEAGNSTTVAGVDLSTRVQNGTASVLAAADDSRVAIAERDAGGGSS